MNEFVDQAMESFERLLGEKPRSSPLPRPDSCSVRLCTNNRTVIATRRETPERAKFEVGVLKELHANGAPVPSILAFDGNWLMQEDLGPDRLSRKIYRIWESECERWLEVALNSLSRIHSAATAAGLESRVPKIGTKPDWIREFIDTPRRIGRFLGIPCPKLDNHRLMYTLNVPGRSFVKWDARPTNAAASPDWSVAWYDWEHCGRRNRLDDVVCLIADESVPDWPVAESRLLEGNMVYFDEGHYPGGPYTYLRTFGSLHMAVRLSILIKAMMRRGEWDYQLGSGLAKGPPQTIRNILARARRWAEAALVTRPLADWYEAVDEALSASSTRSD